MMNLGPLLFIIGLVFFLGRYLKNINTEVERIKGNCSFDKKDTERIKRDLRIVMHQVEFLINGDNEGIKVLIFDDDENSANGVAGKINEIDGSCRIKVSTNIPSARHQLNIWNPDIVFADLMHDSEEYGTVFKEVMKIDESNAKFVLYSAGPKPEKYTGPFLDKFEIMKNPDILKEYL